MARLETHSITFQALNVCDQPPSSVLQESDRAILCIVVGSRRLMPPDALQPKAYCTNPGL